MGKSFSTERRRTEDCLVESAFGLWGGVIVKRQWSGDSGQSKAADRSVRLHDLQNYFAVVFAGLEEFVGFFGFGQGEDVADLGS